MSGELDDSSAVIKLKQSVQRIRKESSALSMRVGVAAQLLQTKRLRYQREGISLHPTGDFEDSMDD